MRASPLTGEPMPPRTRSELDLGGGLRVSCAWLGWRSAGLIAACVFWNGTLVAFLGQFLHGPAGKGDTPWWLIGHVVAGVCLLYGSLAALLNRTTLTVNGDELRVRHGPLPWTGASRITASEIAQLYVEGASRGGLMGVGLSAILRNGRKRSVADTLRSPEVARWVERELERFLHLEDRRVSGELAEKPDRS